ncbi:hypothetical protein IAT38_005017 [Cryptococcus sp. DSM 104549]
MSQPQPPTDPAPQPPLFRVGPIPGKGLALISTSPIPLGTLILAERPFLTIPLNSEPGPAAADQIYTRLTPAKRAVFDSLGAAWGFWETGGRANHGCQANAMCSWDDARGEKVIHALTDIPADTEITVPYLRTPGRPSTERRAHFQSTLNFLCACPLCSLPPSLQRASDVRRRRYAELKPLAADAKLPPRTRLAYLDEMLWGVVEDELWAEVPKVCWDGFLVCGAYGDREAARKWIEVAGREWKVGCGEADGWREAQELSERPERGMWWKQLVGEGKRGEEGLPGPWEGEKMMKRVERINEIYGKKEEPSAKLSKGQKKRARTKAKAKAGKERGTAVEEGSVEKELVEATEGLEIGGEGSG